jgi:hypothetical protein
VFRAAILVLAALIAVGVIVAAVLRDRLTMQIDEQRMRDASQQRDAVRAIKELGGLVAYDYMEVAAKDIDDKGPYDLDYLEPRVPEWQLKRLGRDYFAYVVDVQICSNEGVEHLKALPKLRSVDLVGDRVSDRAMKRLAELTQLGKLKIRGTGITDAGLASLTNLSQLTWLELDSAEITDVGLKNVGQIHNLKILYLGGRQITDAGLGHIKGLHRLRSLEVKASQITDAGIRSLKKALPECEVGRWECARGGRADKERTKGSELFASE